MKTSAIDPAFERALSAEIVASELLRMRVLAAALVVLLVANQLLFLFARDLVEQLTHKPLPAWLPARIIGPFLAYEIVALRVLRSRLARGSAFPIAARFANALIETSLPTVILWWINKFATPAVAFGTWPTMLYFIFIVASTLRLGFVLPAFTGTVAAAGYLGIATWVLSFEGVATDPNHILKAALMVAAGVVAGLVALRLREKFRRAVEEAVSRERVTNLFGQHVSPAVVDRLLDSPPEFTGDIREIGVMFLDIRNFTGNARGRPPEAVVEFLNTAFAFMIEAIDRHGGFINKFLGDGFMAIFGAPLEDPAAARHAVEAAREILAEIDERGLSHAAWPLRVGIGLHVGPAVTGNVGSPRRKEFTAIGDTVNLASRLEQLTKEYPARLIVSDSLMAALGASGTRAAKPLGSVAVKGYAEPIRIWGLD
ncbi:MAG: adenylate/guanylate cyclase domain-containing protein [Alphaproteobacteria bacterium]|nr:adenylate/guanylate cyclase domain-containing protein [Alphaproteobacteria bacterium]